MPWLHEADYLRPGRRRGALWRSAVLMWLIALLIPPAASGQDVHFGLSGYAKSLGVRASSVITDDAFFANTNRVRLRGALDIGDFSRTEVWLDSELLLGSFLRTQEYAVSRVFRRPNFFDLSWALVDESEYAVRQEFFRIHTTLELERSRLTVGRQRVAWGTGFIWNPTDLLNPQSPLAIERDEREGVDAAYVRIPLGTLSQFEAAFAPGRRDFGASYAGRGTVNIAGYDVSVMAGSFRDDLVVGGDFAGYIGGAGFRGEAAYTSSEAGGGVLRATLNVDYHFPSGFYTLLEYHFNGLGANVPADYDHEALLEGLTFNLARHYLAGMANKDITLLLRGTLYSLVNLNDRSMMIGPSLSYSVTQDLDASLGAYFFAGSQSTEFGGRGHVLFGFLQYFF